MRLVFCNALVASALPLRDLWAFNLLVPVGQKRRTHLRDDSRMAVLKRLEHVGSALFQVARGRLNRRLLAWFLLLSLVPLFITNAVGYSRSEDIIRRLIENDLAAITQAQARVIDDRIERSGKQRRIIGVIADAWSGGRRTGNDGQKE